MRFALRWVGIVAMATVISLCVLIHGSNANVQGQCDDVKSVDFESMNIEIPDRGTVQMNHGTGFSLDTDLAGASPDWRITLVQDEILRPETSVSLRLIRFEASHMTGSGAWDHVFIYQCRSGKLVRIFEERYLYGVKIQKVSDEELIFISGEWLNDDAMCCPSKEKRSVYKWDSSGKNYVLIENSIRDRSRDSK